MNWLLRVRGRACVRACVCVSARARACVHVCANPALSQPRYVSNESKTKTRTKQPAPTNQHQKRRCTYSKIIASSTILVYMSIHRSSHTTADACTRASTCTSCWHEHRWIRRAANTSAFVRLFPACLLRILGVTDAIREQSNAKNRRHACQRKQIFQNTTHSK